MLFRIFLALLSTTLLAPLARAQDEAAESSPSAEETPAEASPTPEADAAPEPDAAEPQPSPTPAADAAETPDAEAAPAASPELSPAPRDVAPEGAAPTEEMAPTSESDAPPTVEEEVDLPTEQTPDGEADLPVANAPAGFVTESVTDSTFVEPSSFTPEDIGAAAAALDAVPQPAENQAEKERQLRLAYRKAKTEILGDERIQQLLEIADQADTPEGKRAAMREYYTLLHDEMISKDPDLEDYANDLREAHMRRLKQRNVDPTIPLTPPPGIAPTPEPGSSRPSEPNEA